MHSNYRSAVTGFVSTEQKVGRLSQKTNTKQFPLDLFQEGQTCNKKSLKRGLEPGHPSKVSWHTRLGGHPRIEPLSGLGIPRDPPGGTGQCCREYPA